MIRYVSEKRGKFGNDGLSWKTAYNDLQEAINSLHEILKQPSHEKIDGRIYVDAGTYTPTELIEASDNRLLFTSFKMYEGITVYGGFAPDADSTATPENRPKRALGSHEHDWEFEYETILSGNHGGKVSFEWDQEKQEYITLFPGNSYHVVWFATNGFVKENGVETAKALNQPAGIDGCVIEGGNAYYKLLNERRHMAFGGGAYMVENSVLRNCILRHNEASRRGGAVYMDGGGLMEYCYVHTNQCKGVGGYEGYGGAVAVDQKGMVRHCVLINNMARIGGGLALSYEGEYQGIDGFNQNNNSLQPSVVGSLIANNTASQEAGGILFNGGGSANHISVVRNRCNGQDITIKGVRYGRSAGAYIMNSGHIYNSVFWGGEGKNRNIQMASHHSKQLPIRINYSAVENHDITDWNGTNKIYVINLERNNRPSVSAPGAYKFNHVGFVKPTEKAGVLTFKKGEGFFQQQYSFIPSGVSALLDKSVKLIDLTVPLEREVFIHIGSGTDLHHVKFYPRSALGAFVGKDAKVKTVKMQKYGGTGMLETIFLDPSHKTLSADIVGDSWEHPMNNLNKALQYFRDKKIEGQILVKEGTMSPVGHFQNNHMRSSYVKLVSGVQVYGGFAETLTGKSVATRNPLLYPTIINGDLADDDYVYNACHLMAFENVSNVTVDGFHLTLANAASTRLFDSDPELKGKPMLQNGAGVVCWNKVVKHTDPSQDDVQDREMLGNIMRNCVISNCSAHKGSAVYMHAEPETRVNLIMENCILHNNRASSLEKEYEETTDKEARENVLSTVYVEAGAVGACHLTLNHCNVMKNVGHPVGTDNQPGSKVTLTNTMVWANTYRNMADSEDWSQPATVAKVLKLDESLLTDSKYCLLDKAANTNLQASRAILTYVATSMLDTNFPHFVNPTRNVGVSEFGDVTVYGGLPNFTPTNMSPLVNGAEKVDLCGMDFVGMERSRGGLPDVGALENDKLPPSATNDVRGTIYVSVDSKNAADDSSHGASWEAPFKTLSYALKQAQSGDSIWVAEGIYVNAPNAAETIHYQPYAYAMKEGVNVYGGFPTFGNPGMKERNPNVYKTYIRAFNENQGDFPTTSQIKDDPNTKQNCATGRVLVQENDFQTETTWDGFTLQYGFLRTWFRQNLGSKIYTVQTQWLGYAGGVGAYLMEKGVLENCEVSLNMGFCDPGMNILVPGAVYTSKGWEMKYIQDAKYDSKFKGGGAHQVAAGIYNNGGTVKNCKILNNTLMHYLYNKKSANERPELRSEWMYGAGIYQRKGTVYNTIISGNKCIGNTERIHVGGVYYEGNNNVVAGSGAVLVEGAFFNNTVVGNEAQTHKCGGSHISVPGLFVFSTARLNNCIIADNKSIFEGEGAKRPEPYPKKKATYYDYPIIAFEDANYVVDASKVTAHFTCVNISENDPKNLVSQNPKNTRNLYGDPQLDPSYKLLPESKCFNAGTTDIKYVESVGPDGATEEKTVEIPKYDAEYTARIKDCQIDIGAYELNGAYAIQPKVEEATREVTENGKKKTLKIRRYVYFVTQTGAGVNSGASRENAACANKIQEILDAAGRQRYDILYAMSDAEYKKFDEYEVVVRLAGNKLDNLGEMTSFDYHAQRTADEVNVENGNPLSWSLLVPCGVIVEGGWDDDFTRRSITESPTILTGSYAIEGQNVQVYHTVSFTEKVFDAEGQLGLDGKGAPKRLKDVVNPEGVVTRPVTRAVLDGLYITGGHADGEDEERDCYGGGAVVPGYAHIRNCILHDNYAYNGGGALLLKPKALVSGCLFRDNVAVEKGGAIFVEEIVENKNGQNSELMQKEGPATRARIFTSTVVNNKAGRAGGGIAYVNNLRVNSSVFWNNVADTQSDVAGRYEDVPNANYVVEDYPFAYSAVTNLRLPGINNQSVERLNEDGVRFDSITVEKKKVLDVNYGLTHYSVLTRRGMSIEDYKYLQERGYVKPMDFMDTPRYGIYGEQDLDKNLYIDVGARSLGKRTINEPVKGHVMKRLFVVAPERVKMSAVYNMLKFIETYKGELPTNAYEGASFAFPMQHLDDALRYVITARKDKNIPESEKNRFEIFVSGGTFYPQYTVEGHKNEAVARNYTFLIPEGVSVFGGVDPYFKPTRYLCQATEGDVTDVKMNGDTLVGIPTDTILNRRELYDLNSNDIYEPWEMLHQTTLSGKNINQQSSRGVYHVVTIWPKKEYVGEPLSKVEDIVLDGIQITEGEAWRDQLTENNPEVEFMGGGIHANGVVGMKTGTAHSLDMRKIPLRIARCRFIRNRAGWGGAIFTGIPTDISASSFELNVVESKEGPLQSDFGYNVDIKGLGSAIYTSADLNIANCLFANNEAYDKIKTGPQKSIENIYGAGTIALFDVSRLVMLNSNVVNNKAQKYPAIFSKKTNADPTNDGKGHNNVIINTILWGNKQGETEDPIYRQIINFDQPNNLSASKEAFWFCAYERNCGKRPIVKGDFRKKPIDFKGDIVSALKSADGTENNCNIYLSPDNFAQDGPNFCNPSQNAGEEAFLSTANWLPYRQNMLTDNGWTYLNQKIEYDEKTGQYDCFFVDKNQNPEKRGVSGEGAYYAYYKYLNTQQGGADISGYGVPLGNIRYMEDKSKNKMLRVSLDPNPSHQQTYIDIGLYEYQHVRLNIMYGERDTLWVSAVERQDHGTADGSCWERPTSDLQRAIETLLCSRNGHDKVICLMAGGYYPSYSYNDRYEFYIDTEQLNGSVISQKPNDPLVGIKSLTISGGWDPERSHHRDYERCATYLKSNTQRVDYGGRSLENMPYLLDVHHILQYSGRDLISGNGGEVNKGSITDGSVIPLRLDGIRFVHNVKDDYHSILPDEQGGAAVYYNRQEHMGALATAKNGATKLEIANCQFVENGGSAHIPTLKISDGGGRALLYNSLFHSNRGAALVSDAAMDVVNCTFALNGGNVQLRAKDSRLQRLQANVFWRNNQDPIFENTKEFVGNNLEVKMNAYTSGESSAIAGNWLLSIDNDDIVKGPNFVNPFLEAKDSVEIHQRDFKLGPSVLLLNKEKPSDYVSIVRPNLGEIPTEEKDLAYQTRYFGELIDLGAFEYQQSLQRIIYVNTLKGASNANGSSWEFAYSANELQHAIDMAAVYAAGGTRQQAYVYVKSRNDEQNTKMVLTLRNGVSVYGGIPQSYYKNAKCSGYDGVYSESDVRGYEDEIRGTRPGVASPKDYSTVIAGVRTFGEYTQKTLLDGFTIVPEDPVLTENVPAVSLSATNKDQAPLMVRNIIVSDFKTSGSPVVKVDNGFLYNALIRDNVVSEGHAVLQLGQHGWAVNNTIVADEERQLLQVASADHLINNITGNFDLPTFAPYFRPVAGVPVHKTENKNLWYQLAEQSLDIDKSKVMNLTSDPRLPKYLSDPAYGLVDMDHDLDLLGNPRRLGEFVDYGCFETWSAKKQDLVVNTDLDLYGGCHYPHPGSVVYTGAYALEVDDQNFDRDRVPVIRPGYFLLQKEGGWYGHGAANLDLSYAAVECELTDHNLVALPFNYDYQNCGCHRVDYIGAEDNKVLRLTPVNPVEVSSYNRAKRAESRYLFAKENSGCWTEVSKKMSANTGVYYHIHTDKSKGNYRFTAWETDGIPSIYTEGVTAKTVILHQANTTQLDTDSKPIFTAVENMGWNLVGQPYMVSQYVTGKTENGDGMNVPHLIHLLKNSGDYEVQQSWQPSATVAVGQAFFTQTAVVKDETETLTFDFPSPSQTNGKEKENRVTLKSASGEDDIVVSPSVECTDMSYHFGADGLMWMSENERLPQIYMVNEQGTRFSLVAAAPVEKELPLGIRAAVPGEYTFALPCWDAYGEFSHVWLIDREEEVVTDLKQEDYTVAIEKALDSPERFTLKFGGTAPILGDETVRYRVYIHQGWLHVKGLLGGENIQVYDMTGREILFDQAVEREYSAPLNMGIYVIKVNGNVYKVR